MRLHRFLQVDGTLHGVDDAGELDQDAVAHDLEDPSALPCDQWHQDILATRPQQRHRSGLILLHEPAVADHVGGKNGGETALDAFFSHVVRISSEDAADEIVLVPVREIPSLALAGVPDANVLGNSAPLTSRQTRKARGAAPTSTTQGTATMIAARYVAA